MLSNIVIFGPPGSGKGTNSTRLASDYGFRLVQMSAVLSAYKCVELSSYLKQGKLVPDEVVISALKEYLFDVKNGVLFDGFPRNINQASFLDDYMNIHKFFLLVISDEVATKRMLMRRVCSSCSNACLPDVFSCPKCGSSDFTCRDDDSKNIIEKRLRDYRRSESEMVDFFSDKLVSVDAESSIDAVYNFIVSSL